MFRKRTHKILVVDDSALVRRMIKSSLKRETDIEVIGEASDPYAARDLIVKHKPDLITLDIEMPRMDGLTFLQILMEKHPMPVIILSSLSQANSKYAFKALELGAADVLAKPRGSNSLGEVGALLGNRIRSILSGHGGAERLTAANKRTVAPFPKDAPRPVVPLKWNKRQVCLIGASTGGTVALKKLLSALPAEMPGICVVQHMPAFITKAFAERLDSECALHVKEAEHGDWVEPGLVLLAPGDYHMTIHKDAGRYRVQLSQTPKVWYQRPAVDVLFRSAVSEVGKDAVAAILTGMGKDGAEGMLQLKEAGAHTIGQDENSCVVYGMPKAAYDIGATTEVLPLRNIGEAILKSFNRKSGLGAR